MGKRSRKTSRGLLQVAWAFQLLLLAAAALGFRQGARYIEFALRRSVELSAAQAIEQWAQHLKLLAQEPGQGQSPDGAHLLPIPLLSACRLEPLHPLPQGQERPLPGAGGGLWVAWPGGFAEGVMGFAQVKALPSCQRCHSGFVPGESVGTLSFRLETPFLTKLLAARKLNLAGFVLALTLFSSAGIWLVAGFAARRQRRAQAAAEAATAALQASEEKYRTLVEHSLVGVYLIQQDRFLYCNSRMAEMFGYSREEILASKRVADLVAPEDRELVAENLRKRFTGEVQAVRYGFRGLKSDGTAFPVEVFGARTVLPTGPAILGTIVDNTASERARQLLASAYRAVVTLSGEDFWGAAASSLANFLKVPVAFVGEKVGENLKLLGWFGPVKDRLLPLAGTPCAQVMAENRWLGVPEGFSEKYACESFVELVPEAYWGFPLVDRAGAPVGVLAVVDSKPRQLDELERQICEIYAARVGSELTDLRAARQRRELEQRLEESQKLAALGVLAGGVAHDFNNVLAGILASAESLAQQLTGEPLSQVERIVELTQRGGDVVRRILAFAHPEARPMRPVSVERLILDVIALARPSLGPDLAVKTEIEPGVFVQGDLSNLQQVFLNLLHNARDAMPGGGTITVRAKRQGTTVVLEVEDHGEGIPAETLPRVFEPFFTTKPRGQGTGLGLATAYRTVEAHGGQITIWSEPGKGTRVTVTLPAAEAAPPAVPPGAAVARKGQGLRVLLVDDEEAILEGLRGLLTGEGYQVAAFSAAEEAWRWAQGQRADVAVVDVLLPGMGGLELAAKLREQNPEIAIVLSSGYAPGTLPPSLSGPGKLVFLQKPYPVSKLLEALGELLQAP